ncbi:MAG: hypothetical protein BGO31_00085 [Bacteroidetes bacterium 43-16]|uniref:hypothetical protein n=1 Tax=uncultured Dysgonomonas sp. TaxID=206096 RepID=UPI00092A82CA|nr:hypothetical protein [uncultured Dysgonomonas sp.]OJV51637.1 MAG: hypothetical protein BGO31_00085 [Bacteroidetes bacterium 43-16]
MINTKRIASKEVIREIEDDKGNKKPVKSIECGRSEISLIINPAEPVFVGDRLAYNLKLFEVKEILCQDVAKGTFPYIFIPHVQKVAVEFVKNEHDKF